MAGAAAGALKPLNSHHAGDPALEVHKSSMLSIFEPKHRLEVPLFQRQYVWNEEQQWAPLWDDIARKFQEALEGRTDGPHHFLGAMVLAQKLTPVGFVVVRQVIDGQQRLTTFQIFLAAFRDVCRVHGCEALASECDKFLLNTGMMANKEVDRFKVWPTQLDRMQFQDVVTSNSRESVEKKYPLVKRPYQRKPDPRPRMVEAYLFFHAGLVAFLQGEAEAPPIAAEVPVADRLDECFQALRNALMVVVIDLQGDDDPQVIFETLNARGEPLLPADLLRNYIFFRAAQEKLDVDHVYAAHWARFDDEFWRTEVKQGRLVRPRSDLFLQHFLSSRQGTDVPIKHLYVSYRHWLEKAKPFPTVEAELTTLARQRDDYRRIIAPPDGDVLNGFSAFLDAFEISTVYPFLLVALHVGTNDAELSAMVSILESYFLRRAVSGLGTANYNRTMTTLAKTMRDTGLTSESLRAHLMGLTGDSGIWPDDSAFGRAWLTAPLYEMMASVRLVHIYARLNQTFMSTKAEVLRFDKKPSIEHILPQQWVENWPLPDGASGLSDEALLAAPADDVRVTSTRYRDAIVHIAGNLTLLTTELNSAQKNYGWKRKKPEMLKHSLLPINHDLATTEVWDEAAIEARGHVLLARALTVWPR